MCYHPVHERDCLYLKLSLRWEDSTFHLSITIPLRIIYRSVVPPVLISPYAINPNNLPFCASSALASSRVEYSLIDKYSKISDQLLCCDQRLRHYCPVWIDSNPWMRNNNNPVKSSSGMSNHNAFPDSNLSIIHLSVNSMKSRSCIFKSPFHNCILRMNEFCEVIISENIYYF